MVKKLPILGIILFLGFVFFSFLVILNLFVSFDFDSTVKMQGIIPASLSESFSIFSLLGSAEFASVVLLLFLVFSKKLRNIFVLLFYGLIVAIEFAGKFFINQKGPPAMFLKTNLPIHFPSSYIPHEFFSYPSGHSARTAFVSVIIIFAILFTSKLTSLQKKLFIFLVILFDFVMFLSRVYLGEHWLSDVIGGAMLGVSLAFISSLFIKLKVKE